MPEWSERSEWNGGMHLILLFLKKFNKLGLPFFGERIYLQKILRFTHFKTVYLASFFKAGLEYGFLLLKNVWRHFFFRIIFDFRNKNNNYLLSILKIGALNLSFFYVSFNLNPYDSKNTP